MGDILRTIMIKTRSHEESLDIADSLYSQLKSNEDYIKCNIVVQIDDCDVVVYILKDCKAIPYLEIW